MHSGPSPRTFWHMICKATDGDLCSSALGLYWPSREVWGCGAGQGWSRRLSGRRGPVPYSIWPRSPRQREGFLFCHSGEPGGDLNGRGQFLLVVLQLSATVPLGLQAPIPDPVRVQCAVRTVPAGPPWAWAVAASSRGPGP